jgi:hypothetical protein
MAAPANAVDRLIEKVQNNLGRGTAGAIDDYTIVWINDTQKEICNRQNFWFMRESTTLSVAQSSTEDALPADFKDIDSVWIEESSPAGWVRLSYMEWEDYRTKYDDSTEAQPLFWVVDASNNLILRPVPDAAYTIRVDYWKYLADLAAAGSSNKLLDEYPEILEMGATYKGYRYLNELDDARTWKQLYEAKLADLRQANARRSIPDEFELRFRPDRYGTGIARAKNR